MQAACQPDDCEYGRMAQLVNPSAAEIVATLERQVLEAGLRFKVWEI